MFATVANRHFFSDSLADMGASIVDLSFLENINGLPAGVESTDKLPSMSLFVPFTNATKLMQPDFEQALEILPNVTCLISDGFLGWTLELASKFGIPRLAFYGWSYYSMCVSQDVGMNRLLSGPESDDEPLTVPSFPWIKLTRNDFDEPFNVREPKGPHIDFVMEQAIATAKSYCIIMNSFYELES
ncbi:UDP-glycosyltransferase 90A1 [Camellia lanceoleosa]|uniref:UDP-glycosyltransferase 90A1 n=1 Tax=Camellia lanceoleosa TaxID=1840588 RepID=A0ACC0HUH7_9ERIC|nr:UDP-glycosyltransferase 90A1 [Camellia lanceoleosa]